MIVILRKWLRNLINKEQFVPRLKEDVVDDFENEFSVFLSPYRDEEKYFQIGEKWDCESVPKEDAISFAHKNINKEPELYRDAEKRKFSYAYILAHCGESINKRFRHDNPDEDCIECAKLIAKHTTDVPLILYRGIGKDVCKIMYENAAEIDGVDLYEKSFLYCSLVKGCEIPSQYHLRIAVPAGTQVFYTGNVNDEQFRYEVDIQAGGRLKIISVDDKYINCQLLGTRMDFI